MHCIRCQLLGCQFHVTTSRLSGYYHTILLLLESTVQRHSACIQEDLLLLGQHNLARWSWLLQEQAWARRSPRTPGNPSSSFSPGMLLFIVLPAPTSFQFLKCFPQSGTVPHTPVIPEESSRQILVLDIILLFRPRPIGCTPIFAHHPPPTPPTILPPSQVTSFNYKLLATHPSTPGFLFPLPQYFLNRCLRTSA